MKATSLASLLAITLAAATGCSRAVVAPVSPAARGPDFVAPTARSVVPPALAASSGTKRIDPFDLVPFEFDSARLLPDAQAELDGVARWMHTHPDYRLVLEGHTDALGTFAYNENLGQLRAQAVYNSLVARGVDPDRMLIVVYGEAEAHPDIDAGDRQVAMFASRESLPRLATALLDHRQAIATVWTSRGTLFSETRNPQISQR